MKNDNTSTLNARVDLFRKIALYSCSAVLVGMAAINNLALANLENIESNDQLILQVSESKNYSIKYFKFVEEHFYESNLKSHNVSKSVAFQSPQQATNYRVSYHESEGSILNLEFTLRDYNMYFVRDNPSIREINFREHGVVITPIMRIGGGTRRCGIFTASALCYVVNICNNSNSNIFFLTSVYRPHLVPSLPETVSEREDVYLPNSRRLQPGECRETVAGQIDPLNGERAPDNITMRIEIGINAAEAAAQRRQQAEAQTAAAQQRAQEEQRRQQAAAAAAQQRAAQERRAREEAERQREEEDRLRREAEEAERARREELAQAGLEAVNRCNPPLRGNARWLGLGVSAEPGMYQSFHYPRGGDFSRPENYVCSVMSPLAACEGLMCSEAVRIRMDHMVRREVGESAFRNQGTCHEVATRRVSAEMRYSPVPSRANIEQDGFTEPSSLLGPLRAARDAEWNARVNHVARMFRSAHQENVTRVAQCLESAGFNFQGQSLQEFDMWGDSVDTIRGGEEGGARPGDPG